MTDAEKLARYEAALREIVTALEDRSPSALARKAAVNVAREALAAAQEGDRTPTQGGVR